MELLKALKTLCCEDIEEVPAAIANKENKALLRKLLGGQEICTKEIDIEQPLEKVKLSLRDLYFNTPGLQNFIKREWWEEDYIQDPEFAKLAAVSIGTKTMKAIKKLMGDTAAYKQLCIERSKVNNDRYLNGNLNLSIHPIDFLTLSDNKNNWTSCLSIRDYGCYRAGCLEALTSPYVLVAYYTEKNAAPVTYYPPNLKNSSMNFKWNTKRYRNLVIFDINRGIVCGKTYPHTPFEGWDSLVINTIKQLAAENLNANFGEIQEYTEMSHLDYNEDIEKFGKRDGYKLLIKTGALYNDWLNSNYTFYCAYADTAEKPESAIVHIDGKCCCTKCGKEVVKYVTDNVGDNYYKYVNEVLCQDCITLNHCDICGSYNSGYYSTKITHNGYKVCRKCWNRGKGMIRLGENHYHLNYYTLKKNQLAIIYYGENEEDAPSLLKIYAAFYSNTSDVSVMKEILRQMKIDIVEIEKISVLPEAKRIKISGAKSMYHDVESEKIHLYHLPGYVPSEDYLPTYIPAPI